jgi:hypothetical protein
MSGISSPQRASNVTTTGPTAETVALTIPFSGGVAANPSLANAPGVGAPARNVIRGDIDFTPGTAATALQIRCRQGGLTGNQVGATKQIPCAAGVQNDTAYSFRDSLAGYAQSYVITVQQVAATGNGTVNDIRGETQDWN